MPAEEDCIIDFAGVRIEARLPAPLSAWVARLPLCRIAGAGSVSAYRFGSGEASPRFEAQAGAGFEPAARVKASVVLEPQDPRLAARYEAGVGKGIRIEWCGDGGSLEAPGMVATLRHSEWGGFTMQATLAGDRQSVGSFVQATAIAVQSALGGCLFHAAAVELDGAAWAFIGPSGAGKSTACTQLGDARLFSWDRLLVVPREPSGQERALPTRPWWAFSFPGGEPPALPMEASAECRLPLAGVFRVQAHGDCAVEALSASQRVLELRAAALSGGRGAGQELRLLSTLQSLADDVPLGLLRFPLGASLETVLRDFMLASARHAGVASRSGSR